MQFKEAILNSSFCESLGELIAPTRCAGCERQGELFCPKCLAQLNQSYLNRQACPKCAGPYGALTCTECWEINYSFEQALALDILDGPLARAIVLYKDANERRLAQVLGHLLAECVQSNWKNWLKQADAICWIPTSVDALRRRGFDHGKLLAQNVASSLGLPALALLERKRARDQRGLSRKERLSGAQDFTCGLNSGQVSVQNVLLVDDVFTTGATAESATCSLLATGTQEVRIAVLGRAW